MDPNSTPEKNDSSIDENSAREETLKIHTSAREDFSDEIIADLLIDDSQELV